MKIKLLTATAFAALVLTQQAAASANTLQANVVTYNFSDHIDISIELPELQIEKSVKQQVTRNLKTNKSALLAYATLAESDSLKAQAISTAE